MLLSFELFVILVIAMVIISLAESYKTMVNANRPVYTIPEPIQEGWSKLATSLWIALTIVMIFLYVFFN